VADRSYQLVVRKGPRPGQVFPLTIDNVTVGRDPLADIVLNDPEVSRHHAQFIETREGYQLKDLGSTNGSFVDGKRIGGEPVTLSPGQIVMFGSNVTLIYQATSAADPLATMVAPSAGVPEPPNREPDRPEFEQDSEDIFAEPPPTTPLPQTGMPEPEEEEEAPGPFVPSEPAGGATEVLPRRAERPEKPPEGSEPSWERPKPGPERPEPLEEVPSTRFPSSEPLMQAPVPNEEPFRVPPPPPPPEKRTGIGGFNQRNVIIAIVVALLLCCCCLLIAAALSARGLDFDQWEFAFGSATELLALL
jgi:predicted component of type VI protein secretion system